MASKGAKPKGTSSPSQPSGLSTFVQSQASAPPGITLMDMQKMLKDFGDSFTKKWDEMKLQMDQNQEEAKLRTDAAKLCADKLDKSLLDIKDQIKEGNEVVKQELIAVLSGVAVNMDALATKIEEIQDEQKDQKLTTAKLEERVDGHDRDLLTIQYKELEYVLHLRGLKEGKEEELKNEIVSAFSVLLQLDPADMYEHIRKVYSVNSWVARQRNLPRDVLVHFERKHVRYDVAQAAYNQGLKINGQDVKVIKEIKIKMLRMRKDFNFLTDELKKRGLAFRWEIPVGLVVNYLGRRYRLLSVQKAQEFYHNVLHGGDAVKDVQDASPTQSDNAGTVVSGTLAVEGPQVDAGESQEVALLPWEEPQDKRITRAMSKKMEAERTHQFQDSSSAPTQQSEAVGGAWSKLMPVNLVAMLTKLQKKKTDG